MNGPYDDIIHLPHPVSTKHPQMSMEERAAQFSPFAALTGYGDVIRETARLTDPRQELTESRKEELNRRLLLLERCMERAAAAGSLLPEIAVSYFQPDDRKEGGALQSGEGRRSFGETVVCWKWREERRSLCRISWRSRGNCFRIWSGSRSEKRIGCNRYFW